MISPSSLGHFQGYHALIKAQIELPAVMEAPDRLGALLANSGFALNAGWEKHPPLWTQLTHVALFHTVQDAIDLVMERDLATREGIACVPVWS